MNTDMLYDAIRDKANKIENRSIEATGYADPDDADTAELLRILAKAVRGGDIRAAFGAPGDWGYGTPIGDAIAQRPTPKSEVEVHIDTWGEQ
jgi:hypothetical protein